MINEGKKASFKVMVSILFFFTLIIIMYNLEAAAQGENTNNLICGKIEKKLKEIKTAKGQFTQINKYAVLQEQDIFRGKIFIKQPGQFMLDYSEPDNQWILSDGIYLYIYVPENKQVIKSVLTPENKDYNFLNFLLKYFDLSNIEVLSDNNEEEKFKLIPRNQEDLLKSISITAQKKYELPKTIELLDKNDNLTIYSFSDLKTDCSLPDSIFVFKKPPDAEIIYLE